MAVLIKQTGEIKMVYPDYSRGFSLKEIKQVLGITEDVNTGIAVVKNGKFNLLKFWFNQAIASQPVCLNKKATIMSEHFLQTKLYGDVLIEGDVLAIMDDLNIK